LDFGFFVGDVISGVHLGIFAKVTGPWGLTTREIFYSVFSWKLGNNLGLKSPSLALSLFLFQKLWPQRQNFS